MAAINVPATLPWYAPANPSSSSSFMRHEAQRFARSIVESESYRKTVRDRILSHDLPPAVETMLWHYAYGKPIEQVQLNVTQTEDLSALTADELLQRADALRQQLADLSAIDV